MPTIETPNTVAPSAPSSEEGKKVVTAAPGVSKKKAAKKATKKAPAKKAEKKTAKAAPAAGKAPTKKAATKTAKAAAPATATPRAKKDGLRKPQVRILAALDKHGEMTRAKISEKANVDSAFCTSYIGSSNPEIRAKNDANEFPCLLTLKYVSAATYPDPKTNAEGPIHYSITAAGKKALEAVQASEKGKGK